MSVREARSMLRSAGRRVAPVVTGWWAPGSRLFLVGEGAAWSIDEDLAALGRIAGKLGARVADVRLLNGSREQAAFWGSHFSLLREPWKPPPHRLAAAYFHGRPGTPGMPEFDDAYSVLVDHHHELSRLQVSHSEIEQLVLETGMDADKVHRIPIGIEPAYFTPVSDELRRTARRRFGIPESAFVVGSFQKDGVGWGAGDEPKLIKGPDVLVDVLERVHREIPELHVLLSGPARGYVRRRLAAAGIPDLYRPVSLHADVGTLYHALDAYLVSSRQEGGPKAVLESMATGVPLVTTRVGQAMDLVQHRANAYMVEPGDVDGLAHWLLHLAGRPAELPSVRAEGIAIAAANSYEAQHPLWRAFLDGFVELR
jgi:glycosyltransferase involved in cell wall biosynthesis